ncbi:MAG: MATE family efflux transporter [Ruminococcaceae bacterium]|nr:MATE family efflux transporter [Oscillospiraceae bacterium]
MANNKTNLCEGPLTKQVISFVIPILLLGFLQQLFNAADVVLAGHLSTSGSDAVAAVGVTNPLRSLLVSFFMGCSTGSAVTVSHAIGARNKKDIKDSVHTAMLLSVIIGGLLTVVGVASSGALLKAMSTPEAILPQSKIYLQTHFMTMIPSMVYNFGAALLRANGETQKPLYYYLVTAPVKLVLTVLFLLVFKLDLVGISLATLVSQSLAAFLVVNSLVKSDRDIKLSLRDLRITKKPMVKILKLGIPTGIQSSTYSLSSVVIQSSVNSLSHLTGFITGNAAAYSIENFAEIVTGAYLQVSMSFVGQNVGARNYKRAKKAYMCAIALCTLTVVILSAIVIGFAKPLLSLYIKNSKEAIYWGTVRILFIFGPMIIQGFMDTTSGALRGLGVSISNTVISLLGICGFRIAWCMTVFQIPQYHTPQALFIAYPISWVIISVLQLAVFVVVFNKQKKNAN